MKGKTSIVMLTYNELHLTKKCIDSLKQHTRCDQYELIIVDNASTDGTKAYVRELEDIIFIENEVNQGFAKGCNQGVKKATGDSILFLNNDTMVTENWLSPLREALFASERIGMVGPVSNYVSGPQMVQPSYTDVKDLPAFAKEYTAARKGQRTYVHRLVGFCLLVKRELIEDVGLFDERFVYGSFEDDDLCLRSLLKGYQLQIVHDSFVHHHGHATFHAHQETNISTFFAENRLRFLNKWGIDLNLMTPHPYFAALLPRKAASVLDVGCGAGATGLELINRQPVDMYGVEPDSLKATIAKAYYQEVKEVKVDEYPWSEKEAFFDAVIFSDVLEHVSDPWQIIAQAHNSLKPGGVIICCLPNMMHAEVLLPLMTGDFTYRDVGILDRTHMRFFTPKTMRALFPDHLFDRVIEQQINVQIDQTVQLFFDEVARVGESLGFQTKALSDQVTLYQLLIVARKKGGTPSR
ncbi:bifunctional glycosyltransferase family 2 protein/class I SAM-dependent methyltransferase [Bacillus sp. FJAT-53060]|uniref:bifunctional glycosyltransferase family 2 protein/class I SAM-dependent methyltransferase n=1 Tax=Bacillus TaxID=1386 RepID=UPI001CFAC877|nr:bifunctional glycosyltransferase family 2 protein/class I SAM-dependent methyltransferase [Bacillus stratosphericus]